MTKLRDSGQRKTNTVQYQLYLEYKRYNKLVNILNNKKRNNSQIQRTNLWLPTGKPGRGKTGIGD